MIDFPALGSALPQQWDEEFLEQPNMLGEQSCQAEMRVTRSVGNLCRLLVGARDLRVESSNIEKSIKKVDADECSVSAM